MGTRATMVAKTLDAIVGTLVKESPLRPPRGATPVFARSSRVPKCLRRRFRARFFPRWLAARETGTCLALALVLAMDSSRMNVNEAGCGDARIEIRTMAFRCACGYRRKDEIKQNKQKGSHPPRTCCTFVFLLYRGKREEGTQPMSRSSIVAHRARQQGGRTM